MDHEHRPCWGRAMPASGARRRGHCRCGSLCRAARMSAVLPLLDRALTLIPACMWESVAWRDARRQARSRPQEQVAQGKAHPH